MNRVEWVLFDLGGVLVDVDQSRIFEGLAAQTGLDAIEVRAKVLEAVPLNGAFIVEEYLPKRITAEVNRALGVALAEDAVVRAVNAELGKTIEATAALLPLLHARSKVGCLSNTNSIHWDYLLSSYHFMSLFDRRFASQIVGHAKPGRDIYLRVTELLGVAPRDILFFDDKEENVNTALTLGWNARLYVNNDELTAHLSEFGLL
jgi:HAD superfamily hydrolase (TIGR01509 family)